MVKDIADLKIYIGAVIVLLLQLFLGPIISINSVTPNFLLAYTIVCIVVRPDRLHLTFAFLMGLLYDLVFSGPVGAMAFVMLVFSFIIDKVLLKVKSSSIGLSLLLILVSVFFVELIYGVFQILILIDASFIEVLAFRVLPCTIFDVILAFILLAIMPKILAPGATPNPNNNTSEIKNSRW